MTTHNARTLALAASLASYVSGDDVDLDRPTFLRYVADRIIADLEAVPATALPAYYADPATGLYHPEGFDGDERDDATRFHADELDAKHGAGGWREVAAPAIAPLPWQSVETTPGAWHVLKDGQKYNAGPWPTKAEADDALGYFAWIAAGGSPD